jgi:putative proteasome-type protease
MTYCVAVKIDAGLLFASDTRTNAGVDHIATFRKMTVFEAAGERAIVILTSGNLSISQSVINRLERARWLSDTESLWNTHSLYNAACLVGDALRQVQMRDGPALLQSGVDASASFVIGGQIRGENARLFHVYPQGNFIEATDDALYFQLGEAKYGKPILDRVIAASCPLQEAIKCILVSYDSTMRSNISVGAPIDLSFVPRDALQVALHQRIDEDDPYFSLIRQQWAAGLRRAFATLPNAEWMQRSG